MSLPPIIHDLGRTVWKGEQSLLRVIQALSFWSAIVLPFLYIPFLVVDLDTVFRPVIFLGLLSLNIVTLVVSHSYHPTGRSRNEC